ncbi:MAG: phosphoribosylformylglycinamidine synthase subunit PurQ [Bdellovibrionaceae bacterium]|nr:phosphoribosylformylglycinamidine synthase subunit PurQ [Pseudobdellovibrionaceae bacterium]
MKIGVTRFPGTNCDHDIWSFVEARGHQPRWLWHQDRFNPREIDAVLVPGGFSYGDYLRCGALAAKSPVMNDVRALAAAGKPVLGICNGFQILCESGLLPGVLVRNKSRRFIDEWAELQVEQPNPHFGRGHQTGARLRLPIAHGEGCFLTTAEEMKRLRGEGQIWLKYVNNPNGSLEDIAGVTNDKRNVAGLMPHPERALYDWMGGLDGGDFL